MKDYFGYQDKVCVVTGASSGIGKATTAILVELGARVFALSKRPCPVAGIEKSVSVDLSQETSIQEAFEQLPDSIDHFFGIAGLSGASTDYMTTFNVNYTANMYITEHYLKKRMNQGGSITFVSSMSGVAWKAHQDECDCILGLTSWEAVQAGMKTLIREDFPTTHAYLYSKRLLCAYACAASNEFALQGVRVNTVLPGSTDTGMRDEFAGMAGGMDNLVRYAGMAGRLASSEEVGYPVVFLGSRMASFISGAELVVDYCDNAMMIRKLKPEVCGGNAFSWGKNNDNR